MLDGIKEGAHSAGDMFIRWLEDRALIQNMKENRGYGTDRRSSLLDLAITNCEHDTENLCCHSLLGKYNHLVVKFTSANFRKLIWKNE